MSIEERRCKKCSNFPCECEYCDSWRCKPIYEIYVRSFCDSNGDGVGDLKGIESKLGYLRWLGIKTIWLTPIYKSPMVDFGYDVVDHCAIDPLFGTMEDFKDLRRAMDSRNMRLILDLIPNHTSDQHEWFERSVDRFGMYDTFYVWHDGKIDPETGARIEPNNWQSCFGGSAWTWHPKREQYYLHSFLKEQPNLNYRNSRVLWEFVKIMHFWLELGVDGFRLDAINHIMHDDQFRDNKIFTTKEKMKNMDEENLELESFSNDDEDSEEDENKLKSVIYDKDQDEMFDFVAKIVEFLKSYSLKKDRFIICLTEAYVNLDTLKKFYRQGVDVPFNFSLINLNRNSIHRLKKMISPSIDYMNKQKDPETFLLNWLTDNHDKKRLVTRLKAENETDLIDLANMLLLLLPGN